MKLVISMDVEEEGLFSGRYPRQAAGVTNVAQLDRLDFISREFDMPMTFLVTYAVAVDPTAAAVLRRWREEHGVEIGAHLHPWSTPPFTPDGAAEPLSARRLPPDRLAAKMAALREAVRRAFDVEPTAFRMGRFDLADTMAPLLSEHGFRVDGSMVPLRWAAGGPDHFLVPADPFPLPASGGAPVLEVPLTVVPLWRKTALAWHGLALRMPVAWRRRLLTAYRYVGAVGTQPAWFSLPAMRRAALLHRRRGGRVIHVFLHSSELQPGATPALPAEPDVRKLVRRLRSFLGWLTASMGVDPTTLSGLARGGQAS